MNKLIPLAATSAEIATQAPQLRQFLVQERAFHLAENSAPDEEIKGAITDALKARLPAIVQTFAVALAPPNVDDTRGPTPIFDEVGAYVALTSLGAPAEQRDEFISVAVAKLARYPESLLLPAIDEVTRTTCLPREFLSSVIAIIQPTEQRLLAELRIVQKLVELAGD